MLIQNSMLGKLLAKLLVLTDESLSLLVDLCERLASKDGPRWLSLLKQFLRGELVQPPPRVRLVAPGQVMEVNLHAPPILPFTGAQVESHQGGGGWVKVEKRAAGLYVDGRKVILHLSERQQGGQNITGFKLREALSGRPLLNSNLLDTLCDHPEFIPEDWKQDEQGKTIFIYFWATIFRAADGVLCVRFCCWDGARWGRDYRWLVNRWVGQHPAALLAK